MSTVVKFPGVNSKGAHSGLEREEKIVNDKRCMEFQVVLVRQRTHSRNYSKILDYLEILGLFRTVKRQS